MPTNSETLLSPRFAVQRFPEASTAMLTGVLSDAEASGWREDGAARIEFRDATGGDAVGDPNVALRHPSLHRWGDSVLPKSNRADGGRAGQSR